MISPNEQIFLSVPGSPEQSLKGDWILSPKYQRTGSALTHLKTVSTVRSRYTSNSKLTKSQLFKTIRGFQHESTLEQEQTTL
jgi:hypothetical protein